VPDLCQWLPQTRSDACSKLSSSGAE